MLLKKNSGRFNGITLCLVARMRPVECFHLIAEPDPYTRPAAFRFRNGPAGAPKYWHLARLPHCDQNHFKWIVDRALYEKGTCHARAAGLLVVDPFDPAQPEIIARFNTTDARDVEVSGGIIFLADGDRGLYLLRDIDKTVTSVHPPASSASPPLLDDIAPNPVREEAVIRFHLERTSRVRLAVYDVIGREVAVLVDEARQSGSHEHKWTAPGLPAGAYVLSAQTEERRESRLFIVIR